MAKASSDDADCATTTTIINVKAVSADAWSRAKNAANRQGEAMGVWLSRAIAQLADREAATPREFPPPHLSGQEPDQISSPQSTMAAAELAGLMNAVSALAATTGTAPAKVLVRRAYALADDMVRDARGLPRKPLRLGKAFRQALVEIGQSVPPTIQPEPVLDPALEPTKRRRRS